jgi:hypothetical protein
VLQRIAFGISRLGRRSFTVECSFSRTQRGLSSELDRTSVLFHSLYGQVWSALPVVRKLIGLLVVVVGLLGAVTPVLACSACVPNGGCCPEQQQLKNGSGLCIAAAVATCCSVAPTRTQVLSIGPSRDVHPPAHAFGLPNPIAAAGRTPSTQTTFRYSVPSHGADAALTYLLTARLRL